MIYLDAIYRLLGFVGTRAVPKVITTHPEVQKADSMLRLSIERMLKRGWWFNRVHDMEFVPEANGNIILPTNVLSIEPTTYNVYGSRLTMRGQKLFDSGNNTYIFECNVFLTVNQKLDWEDIPISAQDFIMFEAGAELVRDVINDTMKYNKLLKGKDESWTGLRTEEMNTEQVNVFSAGRVRDTRNMRGRPHLLGRPYDI